MVEGAEATATSHTPLPLDPGFESELCFPEASCSGKHIEQPWLGTAEGLGQAFLMRA